MKKLKIKRSNGQIYTSNLKDYFYRPEEIISVEIIDVPDKVYI